MIEKAYDDRGRKAIWDIPVAGSEIGIQAHLIPQNAPGNGPIREISTEEV